MQNTTVVNYEFYEQNNLLLPLSDSLNVKNANEMPIQYEAVNPKQLLSVFDSIATFTLLGFYFTGFNLYAVSPNSLCG